MFPAESVESGCSVRQAAPGYRNNSSGEPGGVGNNGYSWSSAVSGINGRFLWFNTQDLDPSNTNNRANGRQLRCLSVFTDILLFDISSL